MISDTKRAPASSSMGPSEDSTDLQGMYSADGEVPK